MSGTKDGSSNDVLSKLSRALACEDWSSIVAMARDPESAKLVTTANVGWGGGTALHMASYCHKVDVTMVLLDAGSLLTSKDKEGYTPLHIASLSGSLNVAELLLTRGADVASVNAYGWTPLHACAVNGHVEVALLLLRNGANAEVKANDGRTASDIAKASSRSKIVETIRSFRPGSRTKARRRIIIEDDEDDDREDVAKKSRKEGSSQFVQKGKCLDAPQEQKPGNLSKAILRRGPVERAEIGLKPASALPKESESVQSTREKNRQIDALPTQAISKRSGGVSRPASQKAAPQPSAPQETPMHVPSKLDSKSPTRRSQFSSQEPSPGAGCPSRANSPETIEKVQDHTKIRSGDTETPQSPGLPVLPPATPLSHRVPTRSTEREPDASTFSTVDIGRLFVDEVANLLSMYVCEGHSEETKADFSKKIVLGVKSYRLTGRALLAVVPTPEDLARTILSQHTCVDQTESSQIEIVKRDVLYFSLVDAIHKARLRLSESDALRPTEHKGRFMYRWAQSDSDGLHES